MSHFETYKGFDIFTETGTDIYGDTNVYISISESPSGGGFVAILFFAIVAVLKMLIYICPFIIWGVLFIGNTDPTFFPVVAIGLTIPSFFVLRKTRRASEAFNLSLLLYFISLFAVLCFVCYVISPGDFGFDEFELYQLFAIAFLAYEFAAIPAVVAGVINGFILKEKARRADKEISVKLFGLDVTIVAVIIVCGLVATLILVP